MVTVVLRREWGTTYQAARQYQDTSARQSAVKARVRQRIRA